MNHTLELEEEFFNESDEKLKVQYTSDNISEEPTITLEIPAFEKCPAQRIHLTPREWDEVVATVARFGKMRDIMLGAA